MDQFSVKSERKGNATVVAVSGRVDSVTAASLDAELDKILRESKRIVLDLNDVTYLSSAGVRAILRVSQSVQRSQGGVRLARTPSLVAQVLENVGVTQVLKSYSSVDEAVAGF
jgi:anti-anti-sigma factor